MEELYILSGSVRKLLDEKGIKTYRTFVGEYATSMEMAGASISICKVDEEMKGWIDMPVKTPFYTQPKENTRGARSAGTGGAGRF